MFDLTGHTALITGGNGGLGLTFARGLLKSGAGVAIWGRNPDKNQAALDELSKTSENVAAFQCDVTNADLTDDVFAQTLEAVRPIHSCFANRVGAGPQGITANALMPGYVESDLTASQADSFKETALRRSNIGRLGQVEDMEGVAVFLASRHSDYMTGEGLIMDGGHTIFPA